MQNSFYKKRVFKDTVLLFISPIFLYYTYKNFSINDLKDALNIVNLTNQVFDSNLNKQYKQPNTSNVLLPIIILLLYIVFLSKKFLRISF